MPQLIGCEGSCQLQQHEFLTLLMPRNGRHLAHIFLPTASWDTALATTPSLFLETLEEENIMTADFRESEWLLPQYNRSKIKFRARLFTGRCGATGNQCPEEK